MFLKICRRLHAAVGWASARAFPPPQGVEGTVWHSPSQLTQCVRDGLPEMCWSFLTACCAGTTAESHCFTSFSAGMSGDWFNGGHNPAVRWPQMILPLIQAVTISTAI